MEDHPEETLVVYTDGCRLAKPNRGGIGIVLVWTDHDGHEQSHGESPPGYLGVTPPQMELKAAIEALKFVQRSSAIVAPDLYRKVWLYCDATYVVNHFQSAKSGWPKAKWLTRDGTPVENDELWKELVKEEKRLGLPFRIQKVKGHGKNPFNIEADRLARISARGAFNPPLKPSKVRRKQGSKRLRPGTIPMEGQRLTIHVHKGEFMRTQRLNQFEFTVDTPGAHHEDVGLAYAEVGIAIREGYRYLVEFNNDSKNPRIEKMLMEVIDGDGLDSDDTTE